MFFVALYQGGNIFNREHKLAEEKDKKKQQTMM